MRYTGAVGFRYNDVDQLLEPNRSRTHEESTLIGALGGMADNLRTLLSKLPDEADQRARAMAVTKLDELVFWARKAIDC